jgi:hypothetical protein
MRGFADLTASCFLPVASPKRISSEWSTRSHLLGILELERFSSAKMPQVVERLGISRNERFFEGRCFVKGGNHLPLGKTF